MSCKSTKPKPGLEWPMGIYKNGLPADDQLCLMPPALQIQMQYSRQQQHSEQHLEQLPVDRMLFHSHLASTNPNNKIYTIFDYKHIRIDLYKVMRLSEPHYLFITNLCIKRAEIFSAIDTLTQSHGTQFPNHFSERLSFEKLQIMHSRDALLRIKQPFHKAITLDECIRRANLYERNERNQIVQDKTLSTFGLAKTLIVNLVNHFLRFEGSALIVPTFKTVLIDPLSQEVNVNVFSFVGARLLQFEEEVQESELREVLPFLSVRNLQKEGIWVCLTKALGVLLLGVFVGKQIDLLTSKTKLPKNRNGVSELVGKNSQKFRKILKSKQIAQILDEFEKQEQISLSPFLYAVLVEQKELSWAEFKDAIRSPLRPQPGPQTQQIRSWLKTYAGYLWPGLKQHQKQLYFQNNIVSTASTSSQLANPSDYQAFLLVFWHFDYRLLKSSFDLGSFFYQIQSEDGTSSFNSKVLRELNSTMVRFFQSRYLPQSQFKQSQSADSPPQLNSSLLSSMQHQLPRWIEEENVLAVAEENPKKIKETYWQQEKCFIKNSKNCQASIGDSLLNDILSQQEPIAPIQKQTQNTKTSWFIENLRKVYFQPHIHTFKKADSKDGKQYRVESNWLRILGEYKRCFIE